MPDINDVLADVQREVKAFGDNVTGLKATFEKDLAEVRSLAEKAEKKAGDNELKNAVDVLSNGVAEKHAAIEAQVKKLAEEAAKAAEVNAELEKKFGRLRIGSGGGDPEAEIKAAIDFERTRLSIRDELKSTTILTPEKVDAAAFAAYKNTFATYLRKGERKIDDAELKAMSVGSDPNGGYLVTPSVSSRMQTRVYEASPMRGLAYIETIASDRLELNIDEDEADAGWVGETESRSTTDSPTVGIQTIAVNEIYAKPKATQKLLEDASIDIEAWLGRKIGEKFGRIEATGFISGNGVKKPRGILTYSSGTARGQIEQVVSGHATALTFDGLINLTTALKEDYASGAVFLMRRASVGSVLLLKDGNGQYIWRQSQESGKPSLLLGYPVREAADMPAVGAGNLAVAFGNFNRGYTIVDRLGISTLVDPYSAKPFVEFYSRKRVGGDVTNFEAIKLLKVAAS
jgi:HK97 family phage major capsid protein